MDNKINQIINNAVKSLLLSRNREGHWGDIRETAITSMALTEYLNVLNRSDNAHSKYIINIVDEANNWLNAQIREEAGGASWESEAWDTSFVIMALAPYQLYKKTVDDGVSWLKFIIDPHSGWYDEVWETALASISILRREGYYGISSNLKTEWIVKVFRWLNSIPSKPSGEFVNPHYSGFIIWLYKEFRKSKYEQRIRSTEDKKVIDEFKDKIKAAEEWLMKLSGRHDDELWSSYTFSNAIITYGLFLDNTELNDDYFTGRIVDWFYDHQGETGSFEDVEDTSYAVMAICTLAKKNNILIDMNPVEELSREKVINCFLGYCGNAADFAKEIKQGIIENAKEKNIIIDVIHYQEHFSTGENLFGKLNECADNSRLAIFLMTKDDLLHTNSNAEETHHVPRDNIIFETGYFISKLNVRNVIMLMERGVKLPDDIHGIIGIEFTGRKNVHNLLIKLWGEIEKVLNIV